MSQLSIVLVCGMVGALAGRWWVLLLSLPIGIVGGAYFDFEGMSSTEEGLLVGLAAALSLAVGILARQLLAAIARRRTK